MSRREAAAEHRQARRRKVRDKALILPVVGLMLLVPPVADVFHLDSRVGGVPFTAVYLFVVWALLIVGAALLARQIRDLSEPDEHDGDNDPPPAGDEPDSAP